MIFDEVSKFYGEVLGVNRVTLNIPPGITSLVGPNGSGKTTLMNLMTGLIHPDHGQHPHARDLAARSRSADADHRIRHAVRHGAALGDRLHLHHDRAAAVRLRAGGSGGESVEGARARGPDRGGEPEGGGVFQGHAAARAAGAGDRARSRAARAGRAAERPGPAGARRDDRAVPHLGGRRASTSSSRATSSRKWI